MKGFIDFIRTRGIVGFAVGFILGKAISDLVGSLVTDIINPLIGLATGHLGDLNSMALHIFSASVNYGKFINVLLNFIILAFVVYFVFKVLKIERLDKPKE